MNGSVEGAGPTAGPLPVASPAPSGLEVDVAADDSRASLMLRGTLDIATVPSFDQHVEALRRAGHRSLRIDLRGLGFIDSHGLGALLRVWREWTEPERSVDVVKPREPQVVRVFTISGTDDELRFARA